MAGTSAGRKIKTRVLGIMSGTSLDGVDFALCEIDSQAASKNKPSPGIRLLKLWSVKFPSALKKRLQHAAVGGCNSHETAQLHHDLGRFYARGATRPGQANRPDLVGLHGQTIYHKPGGDSPATYQIGEPAYLAEGLKCTVVSNFRVANIAAGGQGAPLAQLFHQEVFASPGAISGFLNLGGIANVTKLDLRGRGSPRVTAFDTGPANLLIDQVVGHWTSGRFDHDPDGRFAASGSARLGLVRKWMNHPFFKSPPPKSTGRELFGTLFFERIVRDLGPSCTLEDAAATVTALTVESVGAAVETWCGPMSKLVVGGGGAKNRHLIRALGARLQGSIPVVVSCETLGWPAQAIEPAAFAWMAWLRMRGIRPQLRLSTGNRRDTLLGQITEH